MVVEEKLRHNRNSGVKNQRDFVIDLMWLKNKIEEPESLHRVLKGLLLPSTNTETGGRKRFGGRVR